MATTVTVTVTPTYTTTWDSPTATRIGTDSVAAKHTTPKRVGG